MDHESIVRTARTAVQATIAAVAVAGVVLPLVASADLGEVSAYAAAGVAALTTVTALWNSAEAKWPAIREALPAWLRRDIDEVIK